MVGDAPTSTHTTQSKSKRRMYQNKPGPALTVVPIVRTLTPNLFLFMCPPFVPATNSVLNRIIITEEITHIKPLRCHLPGNLGCRPPVKAWQDIRCMGNEICINSVAPSLIYFRLFTLSAREGGKKRNGDFKKKKKGYRAKFLRVCRTGVITAMGINH